MPIKRHTNPLPPVTETDLRTIGLAPIIKQSKHLLAGSMAGSSGIVTLRTCGRAFFAGYGGNETNPSRAAAQQVADARWSHHREEATR